MNIGSVLNRLRTHHLISILPPNFSTLIFTRKVDGSCCSCDGDLRGGCGSRCSCAGGLRGAWASERISSPGRTPRREKHGSARRPAPAAFHLPAGVVPTPRGLVFSQRRSSPHTAASQSAAYSYDTSPLRARVPPWRMPRHCRCGKVATVDTRHTPTHIHTHICSRTSGIPMYGCTACTTAMCTSWHCSAPRARMSLVRACTLDHT